MADRIPDVSPELPSRPWRMTLALLERLPQAALSRSFGRLADTPIPRPLRRAIIGGFAGAMGIDVSEAEHGVTHYRSINDFFVRRLRTGARSWPDAPGAAGSPVDGVVGQHGRISGGSLIQAKGRHFSARDLLRDEAEAERFREGAFLTIYLSPRHYHRIHAPVSGTISRALHVPGALLPVNEPAVTHVSDLFPRNERVLCYIDSELGRVCVVAVGAYNVGRISAAFDPAWVGPGRSVANRREVTEPQQRLYEPALHIARGDELMAFHLGSTIVMLFEPGVNVTAPPPGTEVRLGTVVAVRDAGQPV